MIQKTCKYCGKESGYYSSHYECRRKRAEEQNKRDKEWVAYRKYIYKTIFERDKYKCVYCGSTSNLTIDHIKPRSKGGTHHVDNLQTLCKSCNSRKKDK